MVKKERYGIMMKKRWKIAVLVVAVAVCISGGLFYKTVAKSGEDEALAGAGSGFFFYRNQLQTNRKP